MKNKITTEKRANQTPFSSQLKWLFSAIVALFSIASFSQIPAGYYDSAADKTGEELKSALHLIIDGHTEYPYTSGSTDVWDILKIADRDPADPTKVIGIYSGFSMNAANEYDGGDGWSREHVWAKSRGDFGTAMGPGTDLHHIRAEDVSTNSARSNRNFDEAPTQYVDYSGTYAGTTNSYTSGADWIWEPRDEVKGDIARMIFYMTVRYEGTGGEPDLELTDTYLSSGSTAPLHGKASILMQWHLDDPVSAEEILRNNVVYSYQHNRNPFIDHPEYACLIYPAYCGIDPDTTDPTDPPSSAEDLLFTQYIEGTGYNRALEISNLTDETINLSGYVLKKQLNGSGAWGSDYALSGSLLTGESLMIAHISANAEILAAADIAAASSIVTFNGNDPIGLFKDDVLIDIIGTFNGGSSNFAIDVTKERNVDVTSPNTTYTPSEWTNYAVNTVRTLITTSDSGERLENIITVDELAFSGSIKFYPNPVNNCVYWDKNSNIQSIQIINLTTGQYLNNLTIIPSGGKVDLSELTPGEYELVVTTPQNQTETIKLIKQ